MAKKNADLAKVNHEKIQNELANEQKIIENLKNQVIYLMLPFKITVNFEFKKSFGFLKI